MLVKHVSELPTFAKKLMNFTQFYKENIGSAITKTIIGSLVTAILSLGGFILFHNLPEAEIIQKEYANHISKMRSENEKYALMSNHLKSGEKLFTNYEKRLEFILDLSIKYESNGKFILNPEQRTKIRKMFHENISDLSLNSAILTEYKEEEDRKFEEALQLEKKILKNLIDKASVDTALNDVINDYRLATRKFVEFTIISATNKSYKIQKDKKENLVEKEFKQIEEKFKWNNNLLLISSELILFCGFLLIISIFTAIKLGHLKN